MVDQDAVDVENYDASILKCKKINEIIRSVRDNIKQMQSIDQNFGADLDLQLAVQQLQASLDVLKQPVNNEEEKIAYVNQYRDYLTTGLTSLSNFFTNFTDSELELLTEEQRDKISSISGNIVNSQNSIIEIANS